ncbi:MAG TPA: carboxypeptidase regulatory-like domain-containing protein [Steroidobacteraceae bacterium]|nr:carboxypeptidase regulatory-like domain-containing protein [Steroidobacteraceae bacterium]
MLGLWMMSHDGTDRVPRSVEATDSTANTPAHRVAPAEPIPAMRVPEPKAALAKASPQPPALGLRGRVYDEDTTAPIGDATIMVHLQETQDGTGREMVKTATDGTFVVEEIVSGRVMLSVHAMGYAQRNLEIVARENSPPVEIALAPGGTISGRLVAADGTTPVAGMIGLTDLDRGHGTGTNTSPSGKFELGQLLPGRYQLTGHAEGGMATREIVLARSQRVDGIILALTTGHSIRGVVTGLRPDERGRTRIYWNREGDLGSSLADIRIDDHGAFVIPGFHPGGCTCQSTASAAKYRRPWKCRPILT